MNAASVHGQPGTKGDYRCHVEMPQQDSRLARGLTPSQVCLVDANAELWHRREAERVPDAEKGRERLAGHLESCRGALPPGGGGRAVAF